LSVSRSRRGKLPAGRGPPAEEVDADEDVEVAFAEGAQDFDTLDGVNLAVEVADVDADVAEVIGELLGGALGQRGDEDAFLPLDALAGFFDEVVNLASANLPAEPQGGRKMELKPARVAKSCCCLSAVTNSSKPNSIIATCSRSAVFTRIVWPNFLESSRAASNTSL
jgi:hypothetical protein